MRKQLLILFICTLAVNARAQINFVRNGGFEDHSICPYNDDQIKLANYWTAIDSTNHPAEGDSLGNPVCTPEYCNICNSGTSASAPLNPRFYHYPRTGDGMAQVMMYYNDSYTEVAYKRDYLQGRLKTTLVAGTQYCVTFYATLEQQSAYASNNIGAYLDDGTIDTTSNCGLPHTTHVPQVNETSIINDTLNWTRIQGSFTANGTEKFITIGNFFDADHTDTIPHANTFGNTIVNWYLIDDVSVIAIDAVADAGPDVAVAGGDSVWIGTNDGYVPCKWYNSSGVAIDSNAGGIWVRPLVSTSYVMELDVCGMLSRDTVHVLVVSTGALQASRLSAVTIYPNPARDEIHIKGLSASVEYRLLNVVGMPVQRGAVQAGSRIDITTLPSGVYVLELADAVGQRANYRVVKE